MGYFYSINGLLVLVTEADGVMFCFTFFFITFKMQFLVGKLKRIFLELGNAVVMPYENKSSVAFIPALSCSLAFWSHQTPLVNALFPL